MIAKAPLIAVGIVVIIIVIILAVSLSKSTASTTSTPTTSTVAVVLPSWATEGKYVRCNTSGDIYKIENGKRRKFPTIEIWNKVPVADRSKFANVDCGELNTIPVGADMS